GYVVSVFCSNTYYNLCIHTNQAATNCQTIYFYSYSFNWSLFFNHKWFLSKYSSNQTRYYLWNFYNVRFYILYYTTGFFNQKMGSHSCGWTGDVNRRCTFPFIKFKIQYSKFY